MAFKQLQNVQNKVIKHKLKACTDLKMMLVNCNYIMDYNHR